MRILLVHYNPLYGGNGAGGAESAVRDQTKALEMLGHEVFTEFSNVERAIRQHKPDVVHFHTIHVQMGLRVLESAQQRGVPHCLSLHDYWPFCRGRMLLKDGDQSCAAVTGQCDERCREGRPDRALVGIVNGTPVVTFNPYSADIYRRHGIRVDAIIPHGIDTAFFTPPAEPVQAPVILTMSAWPSYPTKGMHILRAALKKTGYKAKLITGVTRDQARDELRKGSIFVFPSCYEETWGLCLTEAMATGLACIASDVCGPRAQIQHGETGLLFPNRDSDALADGLTRLVEDGALRDRLRKGARTWAATQASLERMGRDYVDFYRSVIDGA